MVVLGKALAQQRCSRRRAALERHIAPHSALLLRTVGEGRSYGLNIAKSRNTAPSIARRAALLCRARLC